MTDDKKLLLDTVCEVEGLYSKQGSNCICCEGDHRFGTSIHLDKNLCNKFVKDPQDLIWGICHGLPNKSKVRITMELVDG